MSNLKAVRFTDKNQLSQQIGDLKKMGDGKYAIVANFQAQAKNGQMYELSCFIERKGGNFDITEVVGVDSEVNTKMLEMHLLKHSFKPC